MEREMLGNLFKYENGMLFRKHKQSKTKWICCNDLIPNRNGYIRVGVDNKIMLLNRLVYLFHNPEWNIHDTCRDNSIDHINGIPLDNKIENLRLVTHSENCQNKIYQKDKQIKGIYFNKNQNKWRATWCENKKPKQKSFKTEQEALEYRKKMVEIHYTHHPSKR